MRLLLLSLVTGLAFSAACGDDDDDDADDSQLSDEDRAVELALEAYDEAVASGVNLDVGPCIAEELPGLPGWVVDVAHEPREDVDDDPANQCQRFVNGEAEHFVELDADGNVLQVR